ncbi:MAG: TonB-dependent receptor [Tannerellaceae bacterium]|jgi:TonB-linked SusC/RagA family outer membrane protein|nr:TonB-dependent receptor [Tannerellaceae bacterium]
MAHKKCFTRFLSLCLLFFFVPLWVFAQNVSVTGTVKDKNGEVLIGVSVVQQATTNGTVTDFDGQYTLSVPGNATLEFSYVGYVKQTVELQGRNQLNVVLAEDSQLLDEVVVIGYGTQRKEAVTGSVASLSGDVLMEVPSGNITSALQGRVAGVEMAQTSSKPGATMQIRIRGTRSLTASNDPLVVLDGIPFAGTLSDINPNDIKSIDILKDASSTAIYGSRGANGVILVTSIKGIKGAEARVNYNGYYGLKSVFAKYPMMDGPELSALRKAAGHFQNSLEESESVNTDWQDLLYRTGVVTTHDVGVSGGTEKGSYTFGVGYYHDEAVLPGQDYSRFSLRATIDQEIKAFRFGITTNNNYNVTNGSNLGVFNTLRSSPLIDPYDEDGLPRSVMQMPSDKQWVYTRETIEGLGDRWLNQTKGFGSYNTLYGELSIPGVEGLKYRTNVGLNFRMSNGGSYTGEGVFSDNPTNPSSATVSNSLTTNWAIENLLTYDRTFAEKHQVNVVAMYSAEQTHYNRSYMAARDIPSDAFQFYNIGHAAGEKTISPSEQNYEVSGLLSYMGRVMYSYDGRYMLSLAVRSDASSRLAPGHQWHTYPAVSAGWNIREEAFMEGVTWMDRLKLRVGYGQTSNQAIKPYATLGLLSTRPYNYGSDGYATGYYVSELPNDQLGWEYTNTWNYGVDFSLFNNRLSGTIEYYVQNTKDLLMNLGLPSTAGVGSYTANIGETENKGWEISLNGAILDNYNGWTWEAGINLYANRNKLVALASGQQEDKDNLWFVGHPINVIYDVKKSGLWQEGDPYLDILEPGGNVGMIKIEYTGDYNADGTPTRAIDLAADRQITDADPDFMGGFNTRVAYKGFDLSMVGAFKGGGTLISSLHHSPGGYLNHLTGRYGNVKADYWMPDNTDAEYPFPGGIRSGEYPKYGQTLGYFDASYLKIRTITLGYDFNPKLLRGRGVERLRLYATVQNPFVILSPFHSKTGMDPETNSYGDENIAVASTFKSSMLMIGTNTPTTRNYLFGINLTF